MMNLLIVIIILELKNIKYYYNFIFQFKNEKLHF